MRQRLAITLCLATCFCGISAAFAQTPGEGPGGRGGERGGFGRMPPSPLQMALDANGDGQISADELKDAEAKLKKLDANSDGVISMEELRPASGRGGFGGGPGGPGGPGGAGNSEGLIATIMGFDANKDGKVTKEEAPERLQGLFERADADKDGSLTKVEIEKTLTAPITGGPLGGRGGAFAGGRPGEMRPGGPGDLGMPGNFFAMISKRVFEQQDVNKDGKIGSEELTGAMKENLKRIDTNSDGAIELSELESLAKIFEARPSTGGEDRREGSERARRPERE